MLVGPHDRGIHRDRPAEVFVRVGLGHQRGEQPVPAGASEPAKSKSVVPMWRAGPARSALSVDYQRILRVLADRHRLGQGPLSCQEMAVCFDLEVVPAKVEALRSKAKRMVARGRLVEPVPDRFSLSRGVAGQGEGL